MQSTKAESDEEFINDLKKKFQFTIFRDSIDYLLIITIMSVKNLQ
jgi:hypothetical protein